MTAIAFPIVPTLVGGSQMKTYVAMHRTSLMIAAFAALLSAG